MKKPSSPQEFKCCWSVQMKSDVACLETYKNIKTIQWSETPNKLNLRRFLDFAYTLILSKNRPALRWDQALLSFSSRFSAAKANRKVSHFIVQYLCTWIICTCESINVCDITRTLNSTLRPSRPYAIHISWYNASIPRMKTDYGKTSLYS